MQSVSRAKVKLSQPLPPQLIYQGNQSVVKTANQLLQCELDCGLHEFWTQWT